MLINTLGYLSTPHPNKKKFNLLIQCNKQFWAPLYVRYNARWWNIWWRAWKITAEDWASFNPISTLPPHSQLNYVHLTHSGMQCQCLDALYFQRLYLFQSCIEQVSLFTLPSGIPFYAFPRTQCTFLPSILLMKSNMFYLVSVFFFFCLLKVFTFNS